MAPLSELPGVEAQVHTPRVSHGARAIVVIVVVLMIVGFVVATYFGGSGIPGQ
jgi:hypothetical protein